MNRYVKLLGLGFLAWLIPFAISFFVFPTKAMFAPFFDTIMAVVVAATGMVLTLLGLRGMKSGFVKEGAVAGIVFFVMSVLIDLPLFSYGPMATSLANYMMDVGLTYLIYPIITVGVGYALEKR